MLDRLEVFWNYKVFKQKKLEFPLLIFYVIFFFLWIYFSFKSSFESTKYFGIEQIITSVIGFMFAIVIPVSIGLVTNLENKFKLAGLSKLFFNESVFNNLLVIFIDNLFILIALKINYPSIYIFHLFLAFIYIISIVEFFIFILLIIQYSYNLKSYINKLLNEHIVLYLKKNSKGSIDKIHNYTELYAAVIKYDALNDDVTEFQKSIIEYEKIIQDLIVEKNEEKVKVIYFLLNSRLTLPSTNRNRSDIEDPKSQYYLSLYLSLFEKIWYQIRNKAYREVSSYLLRSLYNIFNNVSVSEKFSNVSFSILVAFRNIINKSDSDKYRDYYLIDHLTFRWYINWLYDIQGHDNPIKLVKLLNKKYLNYLWTNITFLIRNNYFDFYLSFIRTIINGLHVYNSGYLNNPIPYNNENLYIEFDKFLKDLIGAHKDHYEEYYKRFNDLKTRIGKELENSWINENKLQLENIEQNVLGYFNQKNIEEFISYCCAYSIYIKKYDFIFQLWNFKQPGDASAIIGGNNILPETMHEILHLFVNSLHLFDEISIYQIDDNHELGGYFKQYLALLFYRQYTLPKFLITQNYLDLTGFEKSIGSQFDLYINELNDFKHYLSIVKSKDELFKSLHLDKYEKKFADKDPIKLIDETIDKIKEEQGRSEQQGELDSYKVKSFRDDISTYYEKLPNILNFIEYKGKVIKNIDLKSGKTIEIKVVFPKKFFTKDDNEIISGLTNFGKELKEKVTNYLFSLIIDKSKKIKIDSFDEFGNLYFDLDSKISKIVISKNISLYNKMFWENKYFKPRWTEKVEKWQEESNFEGYYKDDLIFNAYDINRRPYILIFEMSNLPEVKITKPQIEKELNIVNDLMHISVKDLNDSKNRDLLNNYIERPPLGFPSLSEDELKKELKKQVEINLAIGIDVNIPENFKGWYFYW